MACAFANENVCTIAVPLKSPPIVNGIPIENVVPAGALPQLLIACERGLFPRMRYRKLPGILGGVVIVMVKVSFAGQYETNLAGVT